MSTIIPHGKNIAHLKSLLASMNAAPLQADQEALSLSQPVHAGGMIALAATYAVGAIKNVDWDPKDHPRDPNTGQFMKTLGGYIFGKAKGADFKLGSKNLHLNLVPGAVAFKTGANNVIVSNPDGSYELHKWTLNGYDKAQVIPEGSHSVLADNTAKGAFTKIAENPGVKVDAKDVTEAKQKLEHPEKFGKNAVAPSASKDDLTDVPALKSGKSTHTAKQYADYQSENAGKPLFTTSDGSVVTSGSWIDVDGKPYLVHASPVEKGTVSVYRWVSTKQQASNLVKEDFFSTKELYSAKPIEDPTGKPYGIAAIPAGDPEAQKTKPTSGSLMTQAVVGAVPNTATAHKNYGLQNLGKPITDAAGHDQFATTVNGMEPLKGGDWIELEGKPYKVLHSPNAGNLALAKWVNSKKQASNNTYDFPVSVLSAATKVEDPTGSDYVPVEQKIKDILPEAEPEAEEPIKYYTAEELFALYQMGSIAGWELELLATPGGGDNQKAAAEAYKQVQEYEAAAAASSYADSLATAGTFQINVWSEEALIEAFELAPVGSTFTIPDIKGGVADMHLTRTDGSTWVWHQTGDKTMPLSLDKTKTLVKTVKAAHSEGEFTSPYATLHHPSVDANLQQYDYLKQKKDSLKSSSGIEYSLYGHSWYGPDFSQVDSTAMFAIGGKLKQVEDAESFILSAPKGAYLKFTNASGGAQTYIIAMGDNKFAFSSTYPMQPDHAYSIFTPENIKETFFGANSGMNDFEIHEAPAPEIVEIAESQKEDDAASNVFVHPTSGEKFDLQPGDKVWKHKTTPNGYVIEQAEGDTPIHFYNAHGKKYLPKASHKGLEKNYKVETDWPGKVSKEGGSEPATPELVDAAQAGDQVVLKDSAGGTLFVWTKEPQDPWSDANSASWGFSTGGDSFSSLVSGYSVKTALTSYSSSTVEFHHGGAPQKPMIDPADSIGDDPIKAVENAEIGDTLNTNTDGVTWTKVEDNLWTSDAGGKASHALVLDYVKEDFQKGNWTFSKADKSTLSPWNTPKAAPGPDAAPLPLTPNAELKKEAVAKKKPAKKVVVQKTNSFKVGENKIKVPPGGWLAQGGDGYVVSTGLKGKYDTKYLTYDNEGNPASHTHTASLILGENLKATPASSKSALKKAGMLLIDNPVDVLDFEEEIKSYVPVPIDNGLGHFGTTVIGTSFDGTGWDNGSYWTGSIYSNAKHPLFPGQNFGDLSTAEQLQGFIHTKPVVGKALSSINSKLEEDIEYPSLKKALTKSQKALTALYRGLALAEELNNPDSTWDDFRIEQEMNAVDAVFDSKSEQQVWGDFHNGKYAFDHHTFLTTLRKRNAQRIFSESLSGLDFDPYNASTAEYSTFAKSKGFNILPSLDEDKQKIWVLNELGDPTLTGLQKSQLKSHVKQIHMKLEVATAAAALKKPAAAKAEVPNGITSTQSLAQWYKIGESHWENSGAGAWVETGESGVEINDEGMSILVNNALEQGEPIKASSNLAYGPGNGVKVFNQLKSKYGFDIGDDLSDDANEGPLKIAVAAEGGPSTSTTAMAHVVWLVAHANGDVVGKYNAEKNYWYGGIHPQEMSHPGSPKANPGAYKALAEALPDTYFSTPYALSAEMSKKYYGDPGDYGLPPASHDWLQWATIHPASVISKYAGAGPLSGENGKAAKPTGVSEEVWDIVSNATSVEDIQGILSTTNPPSFTEDAQYNNLIVSTYEGKSEGITALNVGAIPPHFKQLLVWATGADVPDEYYKAVAARLNAGEFFEDSTPVWLAPNGSKYPISPGSIVYKHSNGSEYAVLAPDHASGYKIQSGVGAAPTKMSTWSMPTPASPGEWKPVFTMPGILTWELAQAENGNLAKGFWDESELIEQGKSTNFATGLVGGVLTKALKDSEDLKTNYPHLYSKRLSLPENVRQAVAAALMQGSKGMLDVLEYKASKGHFAALQTKGLFDANQPWGEFIGKGQTTASDISHFWSSEAVTAYSNHFAVNASEIPGHLAALLTPSSTEDPVPTKALPALSDLKLTWAKSKSKGMHSGEIWADHEGNEWMSKAFPNDPNAKARIDAETQANLIGTLFGFGAPTVYATNVKTLAGNHPNSKNYGYAYLQHMKPATGDLSSKGPKDLTDKQLGQAMSEHVLDWITSNHDSHSQNLMLDPNGNVFGIDKGQAWKFFPNDKLAVGYLPPGNGAAVWYDQFYYGVQNGSISKETLDKVTKTVLRKAKRISQEQDDEYRAHLDSAFQNRDFWPSEYPTKEAYITALIERKHNTFDDFANFYKSLYKSSPYEFEIDLDNLTPPKVGQAHVAASQDFADEVSKTSVHGKSLFFATDDLLDQHLMVSTAQSKDGTTTLTGQAMVTETGDKKFVDWLTKQTVVDQSGTHHNSGNYGYQNNVYLPHTDDQDPAFLPKNDVWFSHMVQASKTVSSHNAAGNTDYNVGTLNQAESSYDQMKSAKESLESWKKDNPDKPFSGAFTGVGSVEFQTLEAQSSYEALLDTYMAYWEKVVDHKGTANKISPHFQQHIYQPSKEALASLKQDFSEYTKEKPPTYDAAPVGAKIFYVKEPNNGAYMWTKTGDDEWTSSNGTKHTGPVSNWSKDLWGYTAPEEVLKPETPEADIEVSNTLKLGTKEVTVTLRKSAIPDAQYDQNTGLLKLTGKENSASSVQQSGNMYEIDFGGTRVFYRPWSGQGVNNTQRGLLRFDHDDWDGSPSTVEDITSVLRHAGLDLDPATEASLELYYWKHLTDILDDRKDTGPGTKWDPLKKEVKSGLSLGMTDAAKIAVYRAAWGKVIGDDKVEAADWTPKFSRQNFRAKDDEGNVLTTGHPYWNRPDFTLEDLKKGGVSVPASSLTYGGKAEDALPIALSGSMLSSEERARYYGTLAKSGMSSVADANGGASGTVFTRPDKGAGGSDFQVVYHPKVLLRTQNYQFDHDGYGNISGKKEYSHFDPIKGSQGTELMVYNALSVMDDIISLKFPTESDRAKAIKAYKDMGIDTLHGYPIEKIFVTNKTGVSKIIDEIWTSSIAESKEAAHA